MSTETITEAEFERVADDTLRALERALGEVDTLEVDLQMGVLNIEFADGAKYVINSHRAAKQIWMAAERTAWHFDPRDQGSVWRTSKDGAELWSTVEAVLSRKLGSPIQLTRRGT
ncbi:MAG TPA: iron donor protein CyaY [Polyangium sp.]|nr:iron donor protein CyaY [Polyangium sp.]